MQVRHSLKTMTNLHFHVLYKTDLQTYNKDHQVQRK